MDRERPRAPNPDRVIGRQDPVGGPAQMQHGGGPQARERRLEPLRLGRRGGEEEEEEEEEDGKIGKQQRSAQAGAWRSLQVRARPAGWL
jgi:hypothetical protein